jgi:hypothetical protein
MRKLAIIGAFVILQGCAFHSYVPRLKKTLFKEIDNSKKKFYVCQKQINHELPRKFKIHQRPRMD